MVESSRAKSPTPTVAAPATAADANTLAAPQRTGNAAAQERLGLAAAAPAPAATLGAALDTLGDMGAVVLDAMPLAQALRLVRGAGRAAWTEAWVRSQPATELLAHGADLLGAGFDWMWPVGFGMEVDLAGSAALFSKGGAAVAAGVARTAAGMSVTYRGGLSLGLGLGLGVELGGAKGDAALGGGVGTELMGAGQVEATWVFHPTEVLRAFAALDPATLCDLLLLREGAQAAVAPILRTLAEAREPTAWSLEDRVSAKASGTSAVLGAVSGDAAAAMDAGVKIGQEGGVSYVEASMGHDLGVRSDNKLYEALRKAGLPKVELRGGDHLRVRASGAAADIAAMNVEKLSFVVTTVRAQGDTTVEDGLETPDVHAAVAWIAALVNPLDVLGADGPDVPASALPDVALTRSAVRAVEDLAEIDQVGVVEELSELMMPHDHSPATYDSRATLTAQVRVPVEAVVAALDGAALPVGPEGVEARVLDVERVLAAEATGGSALLPAGLPALDLDAGVALVEVPEVEALLEWEARVGLRGEVGALAEVEVGLNGGVKLSKRGTLSPDIDASERRALFAS